MASTRAVIAAFAWRDFQFAACETSLRASNFGRLIQQCIGLFNPALVVN
jgi:hypothetical protein